MEEVLYNPLDKESIVKSIRNEISNRKAVSLNDTSEIVGAGIYAIYYTGSYKLYSPISDSDVPIYIGKAAPKGTRKGWLSSGKRSLTERLSHHSKSITEAVNLKLDDFYVKALPMDPLWIRFGEDMLIQTCRPVWNCVVDGFGNKDPGTRRAKQSRSSWDVLHPGRRFTQKLPASDLTPASLKRRISLHLKDNT